MNSGKTDVDFAQEYQEKCCKNATYSDGKKEVNTFKFRVLRMPILVNFLSNLGIPINIRYLDKSAPEGLAPLFEIDVDKFNIDFVNLLSESIIKQEKHYTCRNNSLCISFSLKKNDIKLRCTLDCFNGKIRYKIPYPNFEEDVFQEPVSFCEKALSKIS
jgi:hypothetical protein